MRYCGIHEDTLVIVAIVTWSIVQLTLALSLGGYFIYQTNHNNFDLNLPEVTNILEVPKDWTAVPYTDIQVVDANSACPEKTEPIF